MPVNSKTEKVQVERRRVKAKLTQETMPQNHTKETREVIFNKNNIAIFCVTVRWQDQKHP